MEDPGFKQAVDDINRYYKAEITGDQIPPLILFAYTAKRDETLFSVSARFNLPYETIALLNGIRSPESFAAPIELLIPNRPGIFISLEPRNDLERLIKSWRSPAVSGSIEITVQTGGQKKDFLFLSGERFHNIERSFFLNVLFRFPLPKGVITSGYGSRISPFSHEQHFHHGVDIAAPIGTEVYAAASGIVTEGGQDAALGNYIVISHTGNFSTIYGHLSESYVIAGHKVQSGAIIGTVGSTGLSTGPHLHFEIRNSGKSWDPSDMLSIKEP